MPNGTLFGDGVCARIKQDLLKRFNLHTIMRLPEGVFSPYTDIPSNLIFFDRSGPTRDIWYYQTPLPEGRRKYTETKPMEYAELADCLAWWNVREENRHAWKVSAEDVLKYDIEGKLGSVNLDIKNPYSLEVLEHPEPEELVREIVAKVCRVMVLMQEIAAEVTTLRP